METRTPRVELRIQVVGEKPREPQVLKATKRHLVCEYDGLVFKQPREEEPQPAENRPVNHCGASPHRGRTEQEQEAACQLGSSGTPGDDHATEATPAQLRQAGGAGSGGVIALFEAEAQAAGSQEVAAALRDICRRFCANSALDGSGGGSLEAVIPAGRAANEEVEQADYQVDLEARKAGLRARLAGYEKEAADWEGLVREAEQYAGEPGENVGNAASPESDAAEPADIAELKKVHVELHRHLAMQAEGLCKLVGDVEELVGRANRAAHSLQAEYHQEKFRAFPHVDSPARLIKEIVKPPPKRAQPLKQ